MKQLRHLRHVVRYLVRNRARTALSATSMAIGIAAVAMLFGVGAGAERAVRQAQEVLGKNLLAVSAARIIENALRGEGRFETLSYADAKAIAAELPSVLLAAPILLNSSQLRYAGRTLSTTVIGTTAAFEHTNQQGLVAGRFLDEYDVHSVNRVAVVGAHVIDQLFLGETPLGERVLVGKVPFEVIGVLAEKGTDQTGSTQDDRVLIPVTTLQRRLLNIDYVDRISVQAVSERAVPVAALAVAELLRQRHGLGQGGDDDFTIQDQASLLRVLDKNTQTLSRFLTGVAALALGLACVGLTAMSLLGVKERRGEVGLRLAVGARPVQIMMQFLAEALLTSMVGALAGSVAGALAIVISEQVLNWQLSLSVDGMVLPMLIAMTLSLLFAAYPAWRAARLDPIQGLRSA